MTHTRPVIVLHGLGRTQLSMAGMTRFLRNQGYQPWSRTYPSRSHSIRELADMVANWIEEDFPPGTRPLAVTHSLGGILARLMWERIQFERIVMLAPPNGGSQLAREMSELGLFKSVFGPAGLEVGEAEQWPVPACPVAVVAGTLAPSIGNPISWLTSGMRTFDDGEENDGTVALKETKLPGMSAFLQVSASHTWIMNHDAVRQFTLDFLRPAAAKDPENAA